EEHGEQREERQPRLAVVEDEARDALDQGFEDHGSAISRTPASPRPSSLSCAPTTTLPKARVLPVVTGWKLTPLSRETSTVPAPPATTSAPSGSLSPPMTAAVALFSTGF